MTSREYYLEHREASRDYGRAWYREHRDYWREYYRPGTDRWEQNLCRASERSARRRFGGDVIPWQVYRALRSMPCTRCDVTPSKGVDHIVPRVAGGRHVIENLQPMCRSCNGSKVREDLRRAARLATLRDLIPADGA